MSKRREDNQHCFNLIKTFPEMTNEEIYDMVIEKYPDYPKKSISRVRAQTEKAQSKNVTGDTEYIPKHELTKTGYRVNYADTFVIATHEEISKSLMLYCIGGLTMNQVALQMEWTRAEFNAIKSAFKITKDSPPFTPYEIDKLSPDEMAERMQIAKKRFALAKYDANKYNDIEKEIKRYNKADYWLQRVAELINKADTSEFPRFLTKESLEIEHFIKITDEHAGLLIDSIYNTYNLNEMEQRFIKTTNWILDNVPVGKVNITSNGDLIHGTIHGSTDKHSTYMIDSFHAASVCYIKMFKTLIKAGYNIVFGKANGSHSSLEKSKTDRTEEDNLGRTLTFILQQVFMDSDAVNIIMPLKGTNTTIIPLFKYGVAIGHGDEMSMNAFAKNANELTKVVGFIIKEFHLGHIHHYKAEELEGVRVEYTESFCGSDQYAGRMGLTTSPFGFTYLTYNYKGRHGIRFIDLSDG